jgi:hypothetical protein
MILLIIGTVLGSVIGIKNVMAQENSMGVALVLTIAAEAVPDASVICSGREGFIPCESDYDTTMFGVITDNPAAMLEQSDVSGGRPVISSGQAKVRVSVLNGAIEAGDFLTASTIPGVAQKATANGYVLGTALETFNPEEPESEGLISAVINIHPAVSLENARSNLIAVLRESAQSPFFEPLNSLRYFLAAMLILISFTLGFIYFGKMARAGVEAMGRNPLAAKMIQVSVVTHVLITMVVVAAGLVAAWLILIL